MVTPRQRQIYDYLCRYIDAHDSAPTMAEIGKQFKLSSPASVHHILSGLENEGLIRRIPNVSRGIEVVRKESPEQDFEIPLLGVVAARPGGAVSARDRIGAGPWQNFKGVVVAQNVDDLHGDSNKLTMENSLTERGTIVSGTGMTPNWHDVLTGSAPDGRAFPANMNLTCNNWTSSTFGSAMVGHIDRNGTVITPFVKSWNAAHMSRSCSQPDLIATGGNGLFYCFAQ
jgi:hypothetical protein